MSLQFYFIYFSKACCVDAVKNFEQPETAKSAKQSRFGSTSGETSLAPGLRKDENVLLDGRTQFLSLQIPSRIGILSLCFCFRSRVSYFTIQHQWSIGAAKVISQNICIQELCFIFLQSNDEITLI